LDSNSSTKVELLTHNPKLVGSNPAIEKLIVYHNAVKLSHQFIWRNCSSTVVELSTHYSKTMFLGLSQIYYWGFKSNTHNNFNYIIKTNYNCKLFTTEEEAPSKVGLGLG